MERRHLRCRAINAPSFAKHTSHAGLPDDKLRRQEHSTGRSIGIAEELQQHSGSLDPLLSDSLPHGGERGIEKGREVEVVEPGERDVVGHAQAVPTNGIEGAGGRGVVGAEERVDALVQELGRACACPTAG